MVWEVVAAQPVLFPPLVRFFAGVLLLVLVEIFVLSFVLYLYSRYGKDE